MAHRLRWSELQHTTRTVELFDLVRWSRGIDAADEQILAKCRGTTLDIGCGPGRMVLELTRRGVPALGIDLAPEAIRRIQQGGGAALQGSVFGPLPAEGCWDTVLLMDHCVGIGGAPTRLLARVRNLLEPDGVVHLEHEPDDESLESISVRVRDLGGRIGPEVPWVRLGRRALTRAARRTGFTITESWEHHGRAFTSIRCAT